MPQSLNYVGDWGGGAFLHGWWGCDELRKQVNDFFQWNLNIRLPFRPRDVLLGVKERCSDNKILALNLLTAAVQLIAFKWRSSEAPLIEEWMVKVKQVFLLSKLSTVCKYRKECTKYIKKAMV